MYSLFQCSLTWSLSTTGKSSLLQTFSLISGLSWLSAQPLGVPQPPSKATSARQSKGGHLPGARGFCAKGYKQTVSAAWAETEHGMATKQVQSLEQPWVQVAPGATYQIHIWNPVHGILKGFLQINDSFVWEKQRSVWQVHKQFFILGPGTSQP